MELFKDVHFDFLGRKWWFILPSLILTFAGLVSLLLNGSNNIRRAGISTTRYSGS
jgi:nucleoside recognition membrane protein YjiH